MDMNGSKVKEKRKRRSLSLYGKVLLPIAVAVIVEIGICVTVLFLSGTVTAIKNEQYSEFHSTVVGRSEKLRNIFSEKQEFAKYYRSKIEERVQEIVAEKKRSMKDLLSDEALNDEVTIALTGEMEDMLKGSHCTGAFLVMDSNGTYNSSELCCGFYLRNSNPDSYDVRNYTVLRGSEKLLESVEYSVDEN